jgi:N-methylhydantoinase B
VNFTANTVGVNHSSTPGLCGGYPGGNPSAILVRDTDVQARWREGELPCDLSQVHGGVEMLPAKKVFVLRPGDVFVAVPHGGGGFGDPLDRLPEHVAEDVRQGLVSHEFARRAYGVALDAAARVLAGETQELRAQLRKERLRCATAAKRSADAGRPMPGDDAQGRLGALLISGGRYHCGHCRLSICAAAEPLKEHLALKRGPLGDAGPQSARRWGGESPTVELWQYFCPHCGGACIVEQHLKSGDAFGEDSVETIRDEKRRDLSCTS